MHFARVRGLLLIVSLVVVVDQLSKALARGISSSWIVNTAYPSLTLFAVSMLCIVTLLAAVRRPAVLMGSSLWLGGAVANQLDRRLFGPVLDFIPLPRGYMCNLADLAIAAGLVILLISGLREVARDRGCPTRRQLQRRSKLPRAHRPDGSAVPVIGSG